MRFNWIALLFGGMLASIDAIALPILKGVKSSGWPRWMLAIPVGIYAMDPLIFYTALGFESMTVMNLLWDLMSDVIVTLVGLLYFKEVLPLTKKVGVVLSFISMFLMTYEGDGWSEVFGWRHFGGGGVKA